MIDLSRLSYRLILLDEAGKQYDMKDFIQDLGWEENENELAARVTFQLANDKDKAAGLCRNGRMVFLLAEVSGAEAEVFRGTLKTWKNRDSLTARTTECTAYDMLHQLDQSQDNRHISSGRTTQPVFAEIAADWGIPIALYEGPNVAHGKMDFKGKSPAEMFLELLDDARRKGAGEYGLRDVQGGLQVLRTGSNETVYVFGPDNTVQALCEESIAEMVTRVKVLGQSKAEGSAPVEAVVDGRTEFGILQKTYQRHSDETIEAAKQAAQEILKEDGEPKEEISLSLPDVPFVRKGDLIYCDRLGALDGYYQVRSVIHDCDLRTMTAKVKKANPPQSVPAGGEAAAASYAVGSEVTFLGGTHYVSSDAGAKGYGVKGTGPAKITRIADGKAHPYHLIHSDSACSVYGWVDAGTFQ